jgi:hypothetical protein
LFSNALGQSAWQCITVIDAFDIDSNVAEYVGDSRIRAERRCRRRRRMSDSNFVCLLFVVFGLFVSVLSCFVVVVIDFAPSCDLPMRITSDDNNVPPAPDEIDQQANVRKKRRALTHRIYSFND